MHIVSSRPAIAAALATCIARESIPAEVHSPDEDWSLDRPNDFVIVDTVGWSKPLVRLARFAETSPAARLVAFVAFPSDLAAVLARRAGANAIIAEFDSVDAWRETLGRVSNPGFVASSAFRRAPSIGSLLTNRQLEVYLLAANGCTDEQIASRLGTSVTTAETHRRDTQVKLGCAGHHELLIHAVRHGIVNAVDIDLRPLNRRATRRHAAEASAA